MKIKYFEILLKPENLATSMPYINITAPPNSHPTLMSQALQSTLRACAGGVLSLLPWKAIMEQRQ